MINEMAAAIVGVLVAVAGYLLQQKDANQAEQIKDLYDKHLRDEKELNDLRIEIARQHYVKEELDVKFDKLERAFREEMHSLGDRIAATMTALSGRRSNDRQTIDRVIDRVIDRD